jgi:hypothetical protein
MPLPPLPAAPAGGHRYRSKTAATWIALAAGALGGLRFYLHGARDALGWLHWPPTLLGLWGAWRMHALGQDDRLASLLVPLLGLMLSIAMLSAIVTGLTPDERWDARHNAGHEPRATRWGPVLGAIVALMVGGIVLMGTIAFTGQRFFEWQQQAAAAVAFKAG